ncbi:hypothetical protein [Reichenbachiella sp. MALMAid0571]|uniref:hypothetical protein n=1 Tax=Reichenbachiella sp. MALMAid0571 TaxID=3143939 RepID=UPI0032DFE5F4
MKKKVLFYLGILIAWFPAFSQTDNSVSAITEAREQLVRKNHEKSYVSHILTGKRYDLKYRGAVNSQFFRDIYPSYGTLVYDGVFFDHIEIQLDIYQEKVVVLLESKNNEQFVTIDNEKVSELTFNNYKFVHIRHDSIMSDGLYQHAFQGKHSDTFIKRTKLKKDKIENTKMIIEFVPLDKYYIKNDWGTFAITNKKSFLKAFQNSEAVVSIVKKNKTKFSKKKIENGLLKAVSLLDPLLIDN